MHIYFYVVSGSHGCYSEKASLPPMTMETLAVGQPGLTSRNSVWKTGHIETDHLPTATLIALTITQVTTPWWQSG
jgi:hypothetical protein